MGFFTPWFLAGAVAVGLPVWLHLLKKHKTTPLPFSSLMFFERRIQSSIKHRRLRYLVLFALRTALILLIVLAFAHPYVRQAVPPPAGRGKSPCWRSITLSVCAPAAGLTRLSKWPGAWWRGCARGSARRCWRLERACR